MWGCDLLLSLNFKALSLNHALLFSSFIPDVVLGTIHSVQSNETRDHDYSFRHPFHYNDNVNKKRQAKMGEMTLGPG